MSIIRARCGVAALAAIALIPCAALISIAAPVPARRAGSDLAARAQPIGQPLHTILELGEQYESGDELYDAKITVVKVLRGAAAEALVRAASASNPAPRKGYEYVAARVRFEFSARVVPEHFDYTLDPSQFSAMSSDGRAFPAAQLSARPAPGLRATLHSGDSAEGWVVFLVPRSERIPLMLFVPNTGTTSHTGGSFLFRLYGAASLGSGEKSS